MDSTEESGLTGGGIAAIVIAVILVLVGAGVGIYFAKKAKKDAAARAKVYALALAGGPPIGGGESPPPAITGAVPTAPVIAGGSCYGAKPDPCYTCEDVVDAYKARNWFYDTSKFAQCANVMPAITEAVVRAPVIAGRSCYGAKADPCDTCEDVVDAYKARHWAYDTSKFAQCTGQERFSPERFINW